MAQLRCKYSGVVFNCEHMPSGLREHEYHHPLFSVPQKRLLSLVRDWSANKLSATESYLLYLSLLNSTDLIIWRTSARYTEKTQSVIANNMEHLAQIVGKINLIKHPHFTLPKFAITYDTGDLGNSFYWIQAWVGNYNEFMSDFIDSQKREELKEKLERREHSLERLIKNSQASPKQLADNLAHWARLSCDFPDYDVIHPLTKKRVPIGDLWEDVIIACASEDQIWKYGVGVIDKLLEHVEENIQPGSIHSHSLLKLLRTGLAKRESYLSIGDIDLAGRKTEFRLLDPEASVEEANIIAAIQSAPLEEPKRDMYPTLGAFLKAKLNWDMKKRHGG